jgi:hypothetical protein
MKRTLAALPLLASTACVPSLAFAGPLTPEQCFATPSCRADFDGNTAITIADFGAFLSAYGKSWAATCLADPVCRFDFDGNGVVTPADLGPMLAARDAQAPSGAVIIHTAPPAEE